MLNFFRAEKTVYSHRNRTIEMVASERGLDIDSIKQEVRDVIDSEGNVEAIVRLRKRFHVTDAAAWNFVNKLGEQVLTR